MNYYDYRSYFNQITSDLDNIQSKQDDLRTSLSELRVESGEKLDLINTTLTNGFMFLSVLIVGCVVIKVIFK